jgi:hypothetical protein
MWEDNEAAAAAPEKVVGLLVAAPSYSSTAMQADASLQELLQWTRQRIGGSVDGAPQPALPAAAKPPMLLAGMVPALRPAHDHAGLPSAPAAEVEVTPPAL